MHCHNRKNVSTFSSVWFCCSSYWKSTAWLILETPRTDIFEVLRRGAWHTRKSLILASTIRTSEILHTRKYGKWPCHRKRHSCSLDSAKLWCIFWRLSRLRTSLRGSPHAQEILPGAQLRPRRGGKLCELVGSKGPQATFLDAKKPCWYWTV